MADSARRQNFVAPPDDYVHTLYRELAATGNAALFVGRVDGVPVAADVVTICGGMIRGRLTGFERGEETAGLSVPAAGRRAGGRAPPPASASRPRSGGRSSSGERRGGCAGWTSAA